MRPLLALLILLVSPGDSPAAEVSRWSANNGQLIMEDIPPVPSSLTPALMRYQNIRSARFAGWSKNGKHIYVKTRFGPVTQLHRVIEPGSSRYQLTFDKEPVGEVLRQPGGGLLAITRDKGGDEFDQVFLLDPENGLLNLLSDGTSLNNRMVWDRSGKRLAYRSTRRNGRSNDIWIQNVRTSDPPKIVLETNDGTLWKPVDFSRNGKQLLIQHFISVVDSRVYLKDLPDGELRLLAGSIETPSTNIASGFDRQDKSVLFVTNQRNGAAELARVSLGETPVITFVHSIADWDITQFVLSDDRKRGAFVSNEHGMNNLYLFNPDKLSYRRVENLPLGLITGLVFNPNGKKLGMTLNSSQSPNDAFVLDLGRHPLSAKKLTRWTYSEVGGLDTSKFSSPIPIRYPSPINEKGKVIAKDNEGDETAGQSKTLSVQAFVYLPPGEGPFPVIIHIHGGPENQYRPGFNSEFQLWIDQLGVAVIAPNIRGSLGYGASYMALDNGYDREGAVDDVGALLDWIALQPQLDKNRVGIFGASYGGYVALSSAARYGDRLRVAVDRFGISNFVTFLENTQDYRREMRRVEYGDERDPEMRAFLQNISPLNNVADIKIPLLIVQGHNDPIVPMSESEQMVEALRSQGGTVWYMNALNEGHARKENRDLYQQVTVMFLQKFLLGEE